MRTQRCHGAVNERPAAADLPRQQGRILILRRHDNAISLEGPEIACKGERDSRAAAGEGRIGNRILLQFWDIRDARIFNTPDLLWKLTRTRHQRWLGINAPAIDSIRRARSTKMRQTAPIFDAAEQQGITIGKLDCTCVEYAVNRIRPIFSAKDGIAGMTSEEGSLGIHMRLLLFRNDVLRP